VIYLRAGVFACEPTDALNVIASLRTMVWCSLECEPRYDEQRRCVLYWLDVADRHEAQCVELLVRRKCEAAVALHAVT
jgi:hypothetical protein